MSFTGKKNFGGWGDCRPAAPNRVENTLMRIILTAALAVLSAFAACAGLRPGETPLTVRGKVTDVFFDPVDTGFVFLVLDCGGRLSYISTQTPDATATLESFQPFVGREVVVSGLEFEVPPGRNRVVMQRQLSIRSAADIKIADAAAKDPFAVPALGDGPLPLDSIPAAGPRKAVGRVIARWNGNRVIVRKTDGDSLMAEFRDGIPLPGMGESIEVSGTPETDLYRIHLLRAVWRKASGGPGPCGAHEAADTPKEMPIKSLFWLLDRYIIDPKFYGQTLTVKGTLKDFIADETGERRLLLAADGFSVQIDCSNARKSIGGIEIGSLVSATGVCVIESDFWRPSAPFPKTKRLFLAARTDADIVVVERQPWWTPARFAAAVAVLGAFLLSAIVWIALLRKISDKKGRELAAARFANSVSEMKVGERTRLATELHDSIVQNITGVSMKLRAADRLFETNPGEARRQLALALRTLDSSRDGIRNCIWDLRNQTLDEPTMDAALKRVLAPHAGDAKLSVRFAVPRERFTDNTVHAIICTIRELAINAVRHGRAKSIRVAGCIEDGKLLFSVKDDGCGFDAKNAPGPESGHFGLQGAQERMESVGGILEIQSRPGKGTKAKATVELKENP